MYLMLWSKVHNFKNQKLLGRCGQWASIEELKMETGCDQTYDWSLLSGLEHFEFYMDRI